jgi:hypothetical protein
MTPERAGWKRAGRRPRGVHGHDGRGVDPVREGASLSVDLPVGQPDEARGQLAVERPTVGVVEHDGGAGDEGRAPLGELPATHQAQRVGQVSDEQLRQAEQA